MRSWLVEAHAGEATRVHHAARRSPHELSVLCWASIISTIARVVVPGGLSRSNKDGFSVTTKSDGRSWIEQPVHWWASRGSVVCSYRFAQRDWKHSYLSTNLPRTMGTDILDLFPCRDCRLLPKLRGLFRGLTHAWQTE